MNDTEYAATELRDCAEQLGEAIEAFKRRCREPGWGGWPNGLDPHEAVDPSGRPILAGMLAARGQVLAALAALS